MNKLHIAAFCQSGVGEGARYLCASLDASARNRSGSRGALGRREEGGKKARENANKTEHYHVSPYGTEIRQHIQRYAGITTQYVCTHTRKSREEQAVRAA